MAAAPYIVAAIDRYEWSCLAVSQLVVSCEADVCHMPPTTVDLRKAVRRRRYW